MTYGITGNTAKNQLWKPVAQLVTWLMGQDLDFALHEDVATGLQERDLLDDAVCDEYRCGALAEEADLLFSFGGDGTLLRSAHEIGPSGIPILGVNMGRLGFLADIEGGRIQDAIRQIEKGDYRVEPRLTLSAELDGADELASSWALNEVAIDRSGPAGLISMEVSVDGGKLNTYWADGLIVATPTGSTAYSLAVGGPIITPESDVIVLTPIASHSLTVRPIVLPASSEIEVRVTSGERPYVFATDGRSTMVEDDAPALTIRQADHRIHLVKLPGQHYFQTLRNKLMWGAHKAR